MAPSASSRSSPCSRQLPWDRGGDDIGATTAVTLQSFTAAAADSAVVLSWTTASELENLGFNLHRSLSAEGPYERITPALIPGLGSSPVGASYSYLDAGLVPGQRQCYELEDIDTSSVSTRHGPVCAVPPLPGEEDGGDGGDGGGGGGGGDSGSGGSEAPLEASSEPCPAWVLAAHGGSGSSSLSCTRHGDPDAVCQSCLSLVHHSQTRYLNQPQQAKQFWQILL